MTQPTRIEPKASRTITATSPYWLWAPVIATMTMLALLLFAPMPAIL